MLVLFDIDGTLLKTRGAGIHAMLLAARELHPGGNFSFDGINISGRLDTLIWRDLLSNAGIDPSTSDHAAFRRMYGEHLRRCFEGEWQSEALVGAIALVEAVAKTDRVDAGLLTGNYEHTGLLKVERAGFNTARFRYNAWADDGTTRRDLPAVAIARHAHGRPAAIDASKVVIIGDTPLDIDCAHANGCRAIAVATGAHPSAELASHSPDLLVDDLSETDKILGWITANGRRPEGSKNSGAALSGLRDRNEA